MEEENQHDGERLEPVDTVLRGSYPLVSRHPLRFLAPTSHRSDHRLDATLTLYEVGMQAKRAMLETDAHGQLKSVPSLPPDSQIEAIFLVLEPGSSGGPRVPPPELAGLKIVGDIMSPGVDEADWDLMR